MNAADIILIVLICAAFCAAVIKCVKRKKDGGCCGECGCCGKNCAGKSDGKH